MLRKNAWIVALFAALAIVLMGCPPGDNGGNWDRDQEFLWTLADYLEDKELGEVPWATRDAFLGPDLAAAASNDSAKYTIVDNSGNPALRILTGSSDWGVGIDLRNEFFQFQVGDRIKVSGKLISGTPSKIYLNTTPGAEAGEILADPTPTAGSPDFSFDITLTQAQVNQIRAANPNAIRISAKTINITFQVDVIEFYAVDYVSDVFEAVTDITGVETEGYVGVPLTLGGTVDPPLATNKEITWSKQASPGTATYDITAGGVLTATTAGTAFVTATVVGGIDDGNDNYTKNFTINIIPPATTLAITVGGAVQQTNVITVGTGTTAVLFHNGTGYTYSYGSGGYEGSWAKFTVNLGTGNTLADFEKITFTMEGSGADFEYKNVILLADTTLPASLASNPFGGALQVTNSVQYTTGSRNITLTIDRSKIAALTSQTLEVSIYERAEPTAVFRISNIVFVKGDICGDCSKFPCECACGECGENPCECELVYSADISFSAAQNTGTIDAGDLALIQAARPDSVVRLTIENTSGGGRDTWGLGHFGGSTLSGFASFPAGTTRTVDLPVQSIVNANTDIQNEVTLVSAELWLLTAP